VPQRPSGAAAGFACLLCLLRGMDERRSSFFIKVVYVCGQRCGEGGWSAEGHPSHRTARMLYLVTSGRRPLRPALSAPLEIYIIHSSIAAEAVRLFYSGVSKRKASKTKTKDSLSCSPS